jgi:hypothetical protein
MPEETWREKLHNLVKTSKMYNAAVGHKYGIAFNTSRSTQVAITNNAVGKSSKLYSVLRLDKAHGQIGNHININHRISGFPDPYIPLPTGGLTVRMKKKKFEILFFFNSDRFI